MVRSSWRFNGRSPSPPNLALAAGSPCWSVTSPRPAGLGRPGEGRRDGGGIGRHGGGGGGGGGLGDDEVSKLWSAEPGLDQVGRGLSGPRQQLISTCFIGGDEEVVLPELG